MLPWYWKILYTLTFVPLGLILFLILLIEGGFFFLFVRPIKAILNFRQNKRDRQGRVNILCLAYMTDENASARHRLYKIPPFIQENVALHIYPPASKQMYTRFFLPWKRSGHYFYFIAVFFNRFVALWKAPWFDAVFLQREIVSEFFFDPPFFIFTLWLLNPTIFYDIDDAIWMIPPHSVRSKSRWQKYLANMRFEWNVRSSRTILVSNMYLRQKALKFNNHVHVIPTLVDIDDYPRVKHHVKAPVTVGWIGGAGNLSYLKLIEKPLAELADNFPIVFKVISSRTIDLKGVNVQFMKWNQSTASQGIGTFDIGVMPLSSNLYTKGKGGFKILEYMAAGIPAVASRVGVNSEIIKEGITGFLAETEEEWKQALEKLITDAALRKKIGRQSRNYVSRHFDYRCWKDKYIDIFLSVCKMVR